jgi:hypothetical protein
MVARLSTHSRFLRAALYALLCACALCACKSNDPDNSKWAPRRGNGTAPEGASSPSSEGATRGTAGSGSGSGGSSSSSSSKFDTSNVPDFDPGAVSDRRLDSLTDDELEALCDRVKSYFLRTVSLDEFERALCYDFEDAGNAGTVGECLDEVDSCLTSTGFDYIDCSVTNLKGEDDNCSATIEDYAGCVEEDLSYYKAAVDYWDCKRDPDEDPPSQLSAYPADCVNLYDHCSSL